MMRYVSNAVSGTAIGRLIILFAETARVLITLHRQTSVILKQLLGVRSEEAVTPKADR